MVSRNEAWLGATDIAKRARVVIPGGVNSAQRRVPTVDDLSIASTSGARFTDQHGREYIDFHGAFGATILGHNDPDVTAAVATSLHNIDNAAVGVTRAEVDLAETIVRHVPSADQVLLTSSGSEATYHAVRLARAVTGRTLLIKFQGAYHGWYDAVALNVNSAVGKTNVRDPLSAGSLASVLDQTLVVPFNSASALEQAFQAHGRDIAAVIIEPILHFVGAILPKEGFLERVRSLCSQYGAILIFDEAITGFRHALGGYQAICGVQPDLTTLGKAIANGLPIGAVAGPVDLMEQFSTHPGRPVLFAGTYNGHPAMAAAAGATIAKLESESVHERLFMLGDRLRAGLKAVYHRLGVEAVVSGYGSVTITYFLSGAVTEYEDLLRHDAQLFVSYRSRLLQRGIFELPLNFKRNNLSFAHDESDIDRLIEATELAVGEVLGER
jgi:glutamate-1-semialdehyde 2,1-aminomutase